MCIRDRYIPVNPPTYINPEDFMNIPIDADEEVTFDEDPLPFA